MLRQLAALSLVLGLTTATENGDEERRRTAMENGMGGVDMEKPDIFEDSVNPIRDLWKGIPWTEPECYESENGDDFYGDVDTHSSGEECDKWSEHWDGKGEKPDEDLDSNKCRNWYSNYDKPSCYGRDGKVHPCDIHHCDDAVDEREEFWMDEGFWENDYWGTHNWPKEHFHHCVEGYGWDSSVKQCKQCEPGYYTDELGWGHVTAHCIPCPYGTFQPSPGQTRCKKCSLRELPFEANLSEEPHYWSSPMAATSAYSCTPLYDVWQDEAMPVGLTKVHLWVTVDVGESLKDACELLWDLSDFKYYDLRVTQCKYNASTGFTDMRFEVEMPNNLAMETFQFLNSIERKINIYRDYISLGPHYADIIVKMLEKAIAFHWFGFNFNLEDLKVVDFRLEEFKTKIEQVCGMEVGANTRDFVGLTCYKKTSTGNEGSKGAYQMSIFNEETHRFDLLVKDNANPEEYDYAISVRLLKPDGKYVVGVISLIKLVKDSNDISADIGTCSSQLGYNNQEEEQIKDFFNGRKSRFSVEFSRASNTKDFKMMILLEDVMLATWIITDTTKNGDCTDTNYLDVWNPSFRIVEVKKNLGADLSDMNIQLKQAPSESYPSNVHIIQRVVKHTTILYWAADVDFCGSNSGRTQVRNYVESEEMLNLEHLNCTKCIVKLSECWYKENVDQGVGMGSVVLLGVYWDSNDDNSGPDTDAPIVITSGEGATFMPLENTECQRQEVTISKDTASLEIKCGDGTPCTLDGDGNVEYCGDTDACTVDEDGNQMRNMYLAQNGKCKAMPFNVYKKDAMVVGCAPGEMTASSGGDVRGYDVEKKHCFHKDMVWDEEKYTWELVGQSSLSGQWNMCYMMEDRDELGEMCGNRYSNRIESANDFSSTICALNYNFNEMYESLCGGMDYDRWGKFEDGWEFDLWGNLCYMARYINDEAQDHRKPEGQCGDSGTGFMDFSITASQVFFESAAWWAPFVQSFGSIANSDFELVMHAVRAVLETAGVYDMSKLTGIPMMNTMRDMVLDLSQGVAVQRFQTGYSFANDDSPFCDNGNGNLKMKCPDQCNFATCAFNTGETADDCTMDPCNDCEQVFTQRESPVDCKTCTNSYQDEFMWMPSMTASLEGRWKCRAEDGFAITNGCSTDPTAAASWDTAEATCQIDSLSVTNDDGYSFCESIESGCKISLPSYSHLVATWQDERHMSGKLNTLFDLQLCPWYSYQCDEGYIFETESGRNKNQLIFCKASGAPYAQLPGAVECSVACTYPDSFTHSTLVSANHAETEEGGQGEWVATYRCKEGYGSEEDVNEQMVHGRCEGQSPDMKPHVPECVERKCELPNMIDGGYIAGEPESDSDGNLVAHYRCLPGLILMNAPNVKEDQYLEKYGQGSCDKNNMHMLPTCKLMWDAGHCGLPREIENGHMTFINETLYWGIYECDEGMYMMQTMHGNVGFCREDGSMELPMCSDKEDVAFKMEFKLENPSRKWGDEPRGYVTHRRVSMATQRESDWTVSCDDGFNDNAATVICRSLGYKMGRAWNPSIRELQPLKDMRMEFTNVHCKYPDASFWSMHCNTDDYGSRGTMFCTDEEQAAVVCFNHHLEADMSLQFSDRNKKMSCPVNMRKDGDKMSMWGMREHKDIDVVWGGINKDGNPIKFEEDKEYEASQFSRKRGFRARFFGNTKDFDCFYCELWMSGNYVESANNCDD